MTVVTRMTRSSRLSKMVDATGGVSVGVALADARRNLAALETRSRAIVEGLVAELNALPTPATSEELAAAGEEAYRIASGMIDAAGPFDRPDLCAAASSLCDLIDGYDASGAPLDWRIVEVHARALALMEASPREATAERKAILDGLADIRARKLSGLAQTSA